MGCKQVKIQPTIVDYFEEPISNDIDFSPLDKGTFSSKFCEKRQAAIDNKSYRKKIDQWRPKSIEQLVDLVLELAANRSRIDRAWMIFYWISQNISYDANVHPHLKIPSQTAKSVFQNKRAVSEGYSELYVELCTRAGLPCRKINGYAKGFSFDARETTFKETNHSWNVIALDDGQLYLVDPTWGSGRLNTTTLQYKAQLMPHFFLCRPEHMIYGHFPEKAPWQLLAHPLTMEEYLMLPVVHDAFFECNLQIISPVNSSKIGIERDESYAEILVRTPEDDSCELMGSLEDDSGTKVEGGTEICFNMNEKLWVCRFAPQKAGKHTILLSARRISRQLTKFSEAVEYILDIDRLTFPPISFPIKWLYFSDYNLEIIKPIDRYYLDVPLGNNVSHCEVLIHSPKDVSITGTMAESSTGTDVENGSLINFDSQRSLWQCLFVPSAADIAYKLTLFAQRLGEVTAHRVVQFELSKVNNSVLQRCIPFPQTFESFQQAKCCLFQPLRGTLNRGSTVLFQCQIPGAREVKFTIDGNWLDGIASKLDENYLFTSEIKIGKEEVTVWAKFDDSKNKYQGLLHYTVK